MRADRKWNTLPLVPIKRKEGAMKNDIPWYKGIEPLQAALATNGAFLVTKDETGRPNAMTIGWGQIGIVWGRPAFTVLVRRSRYTYACIRAGDTFTVNLPAPGELKDELILCGTKSGRDTDKFAECGFTPTPARKVETPIIDRCAVHYECRIIARTEQERSDFSSETVLEKYYKGGDHHLIVFGEILATYAN